MKRIFIAFIALSAVLTIAGCGKGGSSKKSAENPAGSPESGIETTTERTTVQPDPLNPADMTTTTSAESTGTPTQTTTQKASKGEGTTNAPTQEKTTGQQDPLNNDAFSYNDDGAVIFEGDSAKETEDVLIAAAQALFESACHTQWDFTVGCPYDIDPDDFIETDFDWRFYRIQNSGVTSLKDVENDYYKVFSRRYPNSLSEIFIDGDGIVYALNASRGADIFYTGSTITEIQYTDGNEIFFTVENHYSGTDYNIDAPYTTTDTFSIVIESDGSWHAGQFRLPY